MIDKRERKAIDRIISLKSVGGPRISPDGARIAYTVEEGHTRIGAMAVKGWH